MCLEPYRGWTQTYSKKTKAPSRARTNKNRSQRRPGSRAAKPKFMRWQSGNAGSYSLLLMSESTTRRDGWASCGRYCLKASSSPLPPAVALCLRWEAGRLWWLMHSPRGSQTKNLEFLRKCFLPIGDSLTQYLQSGASLENKKREENIKILDARLFLAASSWVNKVVACRREG